MDERDSVIGYPLADTLKKHIIHCRCGDENGSYDLLYYIYAEVYAEREQYLTLLGELTYRQAAVELEVHCCKRQQEHYDSLDYIQSNVGAVGVERLAEQIEARLEYLYVQIARGDNHKGYEYREQRAEIEQHGCEQLSPDMLSGGHGQSVIEIALARVHALVEAHHRYDYRYQQAYSYRDDVQDKRRYEYGVIYRRRSGIDAVTVLRERRFKELYDTVDERHADDYQLYGQEYPQIRHKVIFYQLFYHLNTSLNRSSTLMLCCERMLSTVSCMTIEPFLMKMTSSSTDSISEMR